MTVVLFPNAPAGPRPCGSFVMALPQISVSAVPQLYHGVDIETQKAIETEAAYSRACLEEAERSIERLAAHLAPFRAEAS